MSSSTATNNLANTSPDLEEQRSNANYQHASQQTTYDTPLTIEQFRALVGIPQNAAEPSTTEKKAQQDAAGTSLNGRTQPYVTPRISPATIRTSATTRRSVLVLFRLLSRPRYVRQWRRPKAFTGANEEEEYATSLYYSLVREESDQWRLYHIYNTITYASLVLQLVIASALVIVGAIPSITPTSGGGDTYKAHRIAVSVLGAATGLLTGVMSLLKGQGLPIRFLQYASRLRQVRDKIEFMERTLRANIQGVVVTHQDVLDIWHEFENVIHERDMNRPDAWASTTMPTNLKDSNVDRMWRGQTPAILSPSVNTPGVLRPGAEPSRN